MIYFRRVAERAMGSVPRNIRPATTSEAIPQSFQSQLHEQSSSSSFHKTWHMNIGPNTVSTDNELPGFSTASGQIRDLTIDPSVPKAGISLSFTTRSDQQPSEIDQISDQTPEPLDKSKSFHSTDKYPVSQKLDRSPLAFTLKKASSSPPITFTENNTDLQSNQTMTRRQNNFTKAERVPEPDFQLPASKNDSDNLLVPTRTLNRKENEMGHYRDDKDTVPSKDPKQQNVIILPEQKDRSNSKANVQDVNYSAAVQYPAHSEKFARTAAALSERPGETIVTVNIGRIDIHSASEGIDRRTHSSSKTEFSPHLSLAEYLKKRAGEKV